MNAELIERVGPSRSRIGARLMNAELIDRGETSRSRSSADFADPGSSGPHPRQSLAGAAKPRRLCVNLLEHNEKDPSP